MDDQLVMIGARIGARIGAVIGASIGGDPLGAGIPFPSRDGPQNVLTPEFGVQWPMINATWPSPSYYFPMQESSGDLVDVLNGGTMQQTGAGTYGTSIANWKRKFISTTEVASQKWSAAQFTLWNGNSQSLFAYGLIRFDTVTSTRYWADLVGNDVAVQILVNGHIRTVRTGNTVDGLLNHVGSTVRPYVIEWIGGTGMTGHTGAGLYRVSTDIEQITNSWAVFLDGTKGIGALAAGVPPVADFSALWMWVGQDAEFMSATVTPKTMLQTLGWAVSGY